MKMPKLNSLKREKKRTGNKNIRKYIISAAVVVLALSGCGVSYGMIASKDADHGYNEYTAMNNESVQVFPQGKGYKLTEEQARQYQLQEKQKKQSENKNNTINKTNTSTNKNTTRFNTNRSGRTLKINRSTSKDVVLFSDIKTSYKAGDTAKFYIVTKTRGNKAIDNKNVTIKYGDQVLKGKKGDAGKYNYSFKVEKGLVKLQIVVKKTANNNALHQQRNIQGRGDGDDSDDNNITIAPVKTKYTAGQSEKIYFEITKGNGKSFKPDPGLISVKYNNKTYSVDKDENGYYCKVRIASGKNTMTINLAKSSKNDKWSGSYSITGKTDEYDVPVSADVPIEGIDLDFTLDPYQASEDSIVEDIIGSILGDYKYKSEDGQIVRISGFEKNSNCHLSDDAKATFAKSLNIDESDFSDVNTGTSGKIDNGAFHDGLGWIITDGDGNVLSLDDSVPEGTEIILSYGVITE